MTTQHIYSNGYSTFETGELVRVDLGAVDSCIYRVRVFRRVSTGYDFSLDHLTRAKLSYVSGEQTEEVLRNLREPDNGIIDIEAANLVKLSPLEALAAQAV